MLHQVLVTVKKPFIKAVPVPTPECVSGSGKVREVAEQCQKLSVNKPLIVTDSVLYKLGLLDSMLEAMQASGIQYQLFAEVEPDPDYALIRQGAAQYNNMQCDGIVAFGGGSAIDCAKAIGASVKTNKDVSKLPGLLKVHRTLMPIIAIPTTAGTGSECTVAAVVSDKQNQSKRSITDPFLVPKVAVIDPQVMLGLPPQITAETGIDALTHAIESYLSSYSNTHTRQLAISATKRIFEFLPVAFENGQDQEAREEMALASYEAGLAFTRTYIGYVHAIAHQLGALYHVPHGRANAIVIRYVLRYYKEHHSETLEQLAMDLNVQSGIALIRRIEVLLENLNLPSVVAELKEEDIPKIASMAIKEAFGEYPVPVEMSVKDCEEILYSLLLKTSPA